MHVVHTCSLCLPPPPRLPNRYPNYNFIGLVIGPRGATQKQMEKETGAKIVIRGKGSAKQGAASRADNDDDDAIHVLIQADTEAQVSQGHTLPWVWFELVLLRCILQRAYSR